MKLLFDENLSPFLVTALDDLYPGSSHVHLEGLGGASEPVVRGRAKAAGFVIVSKDTDHVDLAMTSGFPPKVISIMLGNCPTRLVESLLRIRAHEILRFGDDPIEPVLFLP